MPAYKFYNIGKANAEIDRLTAEVLKLEGAAKAAPAAEDVQKTHAAEIKELTDGHAEAIAAKDKEISDLQANHQAEVKKLTEGHASALAAKDVLISEAQKKGISQLAKTGHVPVPAEAGNASGETLDGIRAKIAAETNPEKRFALAAKARELRNNQ